MKTKLFDYQQAIVDKEKHNKGVALFLDMGCGKTLTSLALVEQWNKPKLLVICILSKLNDWQEEIKKELNRDAIILNEGTTKNKQLLSQNNDTYIVNFESAWRLTELLKWVDKDTAIIIDESHKIKSVKSKIGKFCAKLKFKTKTKCILTGTPQSKGFIDYYNQLYFIDMINLSYKMFCDTYCVYEVQQFSGYPFKKLVGYKNTYNLEKLIKDKCVFFKRDINNDQIPTEIDIRLDKPKIYDKFKKFRVYEDYAADNSSKLFVTLRKICSGNIDDYTVDTQKIDWLEDFLEDLNERVVIFYNFNCERDRIINLLQRMKIPYSQYNGEVKDINNFLIHKNGVVLCQYMSASLGLNSLVKSHICVMYSPSTNYTDYIQSKKRIDRIGQTQKPLFYNLICKGTVEEKILKTTKQGINFDLKMFEDYINKQGGIK